MRPRIAIRLATLLVLLAGPVAAGAAEQLLFTGNEHAVWLIRRDADGKGLDILSRPKSGKWKTVQSGFQGVAAGAVTVGGSLHVLFRPTGHTAFHLAGPARTVELDPEDANWTPVGPPLALCEARGFGDVDAPIILAVLPIRNKRSATTRPTPASAPTTGPTTGPAPRRGQVLRRLRIGVFRYDLGQWSFVTEMPEGQIPPGADVFAAAAEGALYVLYPDPATRWNALVVYRDGAWAPVPLDPAAAKSKIIGMQSLGGKLSIVFARPDDDPSKVSLRLATLAGGTGAERFSIRAIAKDGAPRRWPHEAALHAAAFANGQLGLLWRHEGALRFATCDRTGAVLAIEDVKPRDADDGMGEQIVRNFILGILIATFIPMILMRSKAAPTPFGLDPGLRAASPVRRLLAAIVDVLPTFAIGGGLMLPQIPQEQLWQLMQEVYRQERAVPAQFAYAAVASLLLFLVYGIVMEMAFGATLGKMLLKTRVVGDQGRSPTLREVLLRNLWKIIELFLPFGMPLLPLVILFNRHHQRVGDWLARTAVVDRRPLPPTPAATDADQSPEDPSEE